MSRNMEDLTEESEVEVEEPLGNPAPPPDVDLEKLRGDRIGDTVFSGKWCIQTVMKLMQSNVVMKPDAGDDADDIVDMEEELQNEVGALWDMTSNVQVCQYLHSVGAVESICFVISNSRCPRATEMCVGMLANIIYHNEIWDIMKSDTSFFSILIQLLTSTDQPVLLEVNRFFNTALCHHSSEVFYTSLNESGQLVVQEVLRILSGSTNGDLLKQVTELVYSLMYRDENDTQFNSRFADPDFVLAVVEASKELGLTHESSGQNYIMEIFHSFTTYQAGVVAIGAVLEEMSASSTAYLRVLCQQGLSLASSCQVLTAILSTLHHIMPRSGAVKESLLASPSFLHCVLITLVALYRKLGQYHAISDPLHNRRAIRKHQLGTAQTTWQSQEDEAEVARQSGGGEPEEDVKPNKSPSSGAGGANDPQASWSERAFAAARLGGASSETATFRTPEASPRLAYKDSGRATRDLDVSWSERRFASPLVAEEDDGDSEQWKQPRERRRFKRREKSGPDREKRETQRKTSVDKAKDNSEDESEERFKQESPETPSGISSPKAAPLDGDGFSKEEDPSSENEPPGSTLNQTEKSLQIEDSSNILKAMRIQGQSRADSDSRLSGGFIPSTDASDIETGADRSAAEGKKEVQAESKEDTSVHFSSPSKLTTHTNSAEADRSNDPGKGNVIQDENDEAMAGVDVGFDYMEKEEEEDWGGEMNKSVGGNSGHKYWRLLGVIRDLLVDYVTGMSEAPGEQDGSTPVISSTMKYLDHQCSSTELRALTRCLRDALGLETSSEPASVEDGQLALRHLLGLCDSFRASRLKSVLTDCFANGTS